MNENKKRFNIIDVVLILALIAVVAGVAVRSGFTDKFSQKLDGGYIEYDFIINSIKATSQERFEEGTKIYSQTTQNEIGEITSVEFRGAEAYIELPSGEIVKTVIPDRIDVIGKAKVKGNLDSDGRCMLEGTTHIAAGKNIFARTKDITFMFTVEGAKFISESEKEQPESDSNIVSDITEESEGSAVEDNSQTTDEAQPLDGDEIPIPSEEIQNDGSENISNE